MKLAIFLGMSAYLGLTWAALRGSRCTEEPSTDGPTTENPSTGGPAGSCGCGQANKVLRIVGGEETEVNEYPWQVAIMYDEQQICGGSLVSDKYVVTAAHCTQYAVGKYSVQLGAHNISIPDGVNIKAKKIINHKGYNSNSMKNDIAVIELEEKATLGSSVGVVCLPPKNKDYAGKMAVISGWGTLESGGDSPNELQDTTVKVMTNGACKKLSGNQYKLTKDMVCATGDGVRDTCQGDSGGPMVVDVDGHHDLVGVTSWGFGCAAPKYPGVYSRVTKNLKWLNKQIKKSGTTCQ